MATSNKGNIRFLLDAEARASEIVKEAKKNRLLKLKQAKVEADKEIKKFLEERESKFQEYKKKILGTTNESKGDLEKKKETAINAIKKQSSEKREEAVSFLLKHVTTVQFD